VHEGRSYFMSLAVASVLGVLATLAVAPGGLAQTGAGQPAAETQWRDGHNSRARLVAGGPAGAQFAGVEIEMAPGWKTYWRNPGDAGGVPPYFDWSASENLAAATVSYPAPKRLHDAAGDAIGYKSRVLFPVAISPSDPARPITLALAFEYGVCREICIPAEARFELVVPPASLAEALPAAIAASLARVPREPGSPGANQPRVESLDYALAADAPRLRFEVAYPGSSEGADAFIAAPDGLFVPQPRVVPASRKDRVAFEVDLADGVDLDALRGKALGLTLVSETSQALVYVKAD